MAVCFLIYMVTTTLVNHSLFFSSTTQQLTLFSNMDSHTLYRLKQFNYTIQGSLSQCMTVSGLHGHSHEISYNLNSV